MPSEPAEKNSGAHAARSPTFLANLAAAKEILHEWRRHVQVIFD